MKILKYFLSLATAAGLMASCSSDLEEVRAYAPEDVKAPAIHALDVTDINITADNQVETLLFSWDAADFGCSTAINYSVVAAYGEVQLPVVSGITDPDPKTDAPITASITYEALNKTLALSVEDGGLGCPVGETATVEFCISATIGQTYPAVYSEWVSLNVSTTAAEKTFQMIYMPGSYQGWSPADAATNFQVLYDFAGNGVFEGIADFGQAEDAARAWKFTTNPDWSFDYGVPKGTTPEAEAASIALINNDGGDRDDIKAYTKNRYYHFSMDSNTGLLTKNYAFNSIGVIGDFNGWGGDVEMTFNAAKRRFYADVENLSGTFKFRLDADWSTVNWGGADGVAVSGGDNIAVAEAGNYRVYLYISDPNDLRYELDASMFGKENDGVVAPVQPIEPEVEKGGSIIYVNNEDGWEATYLYTWNAVEGGESTGLTNAWPGKEMTLTATLNGKNYVGYEMPATTNGFSIKYIFNNNAGSQTADSEAITLDRNYYFTLKDGVATEDTVEEVVYKLYFDVTAAGWENVNAWIWDADGNNYTGGVWPGQALASEEQDGKTYWVYEAPVTVTGKTLSVIVNNGTEQTVDIAGVVMDADHVITLTEKDADGKMWLATIDGAEAPAPEDPVVVLADHTWGVIGVNGAWNENDDKVMTAQDGWVVAAGVTFDADNSEFKVRADGKWDISYGTGKVAAVVGGEPFAVTYKADNIIMPTAGTYDIYFTIVDNVASMKVVAVDGGETPTPTPSPSTEGYKIYAYSENGWTNMNLYSWDAAGDPLTGSWSGSPMSTEEVNGLTYFVYQMEESLNGQTINIIFNNGSAQTNDIKNVLLDKDLYYAVNGSSATVIDPATYTPPTAGGSDAAKLYLKPNSNWTTDGARFAAYAWNASGNTWVSMTASSTSGVYECDFPEGYTNVIFCRMNPAATDNNWDNKWNQTGDLTVPTDGKNYYVVPNGAWDGSDDSNWTTL